MYALSKVSCDVGPESCSKSAVRRYVRVEMHMDISQGQLYAKIYTTAKMPCNSKATTTLCEPAQSKRSIRSHKSYSMREFTG